MRGVTIKYDGSVVQPLKAGPTNSPVKGCSIKSKSWKWGVYHLYIHIYIYICIYPIDSYMLSAFYQHSVMTFPHHYHCLSDFWKIAVT